LGLPAIRLRSRSGIYRGNSEGMKPDGAIPG
jgi:hypothetical protein